MRRVCRLVRRGRERPVPPQLAHQGREGAGTGARSHLPTPHPQWAGVLSRLALEQERILNPLLDRVRTADHHQLRSLTGLIRNLSRNTRNKDEMCESGSPQPGLARTPPSGLGPELGLYSGWLEPGGQTGTPTPWGLGVGLTLTSRPPAATKVVSHLIEKLPGSVGEKAPPADVLVNIIAVLNNLVVASPVAARDLLYFDGLRKLVFIKKRRDRWGP